MPNPRLAARYAKSLLVLAQEQQQLDAVYADMQWLAAACSQSPDLANLLRSPIIKADKKNLALTAVTTGKVGTLTAAFNKLLISKGRESNLHEIADAFIAQYKELKGIHDVKLTTAVPVSETTKTALLNRLQAETQMENIQLEVVVDESILGGFKLEMKDTVVDASVARDLRDIRKQFLNNDYLYKIR